MSEQKNEEIQSLVKKKRHWVPNPKENFCEEYAKPGDNSRYLRYAMASLSLPPIDISDQHQVEQRIDDYFQYCLDNDRKPNMIGVANWLGISRDTLNSWKRGEYRSSTHSDLIKKVVGILEELWVDYMQNGKMNPASGIFIAKNLFGYKDQQDVVLTPNNPLGETVDRKQLEAAIVEEEMQE